MGRSGHSAGHVRGIVAAGRAVLARVGVAGDGRPAPRHLRHGVAVDELAVVRDHRLDDRRRWRRVVLRRDDERDAVDVGVARCPSATRRRADPGSARSRRGWRRACGRGCRRGCPTASGAGCRCSGPARAARARGTAQSAERRAEEGRARAAVGGHADAARQTDRRRARPTCTCRGAA